MKTSPLRLKSAAAAEDRARSVRSFAAAAALYAPLLIGTLWAMPESAYRAAGEAVSVSMAFSQFAGAAPATEEVAAPEPQQAPEQVEEPLEQPVEEAQPEPTPEPEPVVEPTPEPKPEPKPESKPEPKPEPVKKVVEKKVVKKVQKPEPVKKVVEKKVVKKVQKPAQKPVESPAQVAKTDAKPAPAPSPVPSAAAGASAPGAASSSDAGGISTLVDGESVDPFLSEVKRLVEHSLEYPRKARAMKLEGSSVLQFTVAADGALRDLDVWKTAGHKDLDVAAIRAVKRASKRWSAPGKDVRLRFPIRFELI